MFDEGPEAFTKRMVVWIIRVFKDAIYIVPVGLAGLLLDFTSQGFMLFNIPRIMCSVLNSKVFVCFLIRCFRSALIQGRRFFSLAVFDGINLSMPHSGGV